MILPLAAVLGLLASGCSRPAPADPSTQVLRVAHRNEPATLDPHLATLPDEFIVLRALSEGLVVPNPDGGTPLPGVARHWESSADGLTWTFHLREDARWSNGDPVTAHDFVYSVKRVLTPATAAPRTPLFYPLRHARDYLLGRVTDFAEVGISARGPHTLVIMLEHRADELLSLLASGPWLPVHQATVERHGRQWTRPGHFVGNGPFTLAEWLPHQRITVRRNPGYWDAAAIKLGAVSMLAFDSSDTEERTFRAGQLDVTITVPFAKLEGYRRATPSLLNTVPLHETRFVSLNVTRWPLNDVRVRQALSLALDRRILVEKVMKGGQRPAYNFISPGLGGYTPSAALTENAAEARRLLAAAGFPGGRGFPPMELVTWGAGNLVLEAMQQRWRSELGITVTIVQREAHSHLAGLSRGDYALGYVTAIPDYDSPLDLLQRLTTGDTSNYPQWSDPAFDRLVTAHDLSGAEQLLLEQLPVIPLYFNNRNYLLRPSVRGWREDALWTRYYKHVYLDEK